MITAHACAKANLSLWVGSRRDDGRHVLSGVFQSVLWTDRLTLEDADSDSIQSESGGEVVDGWGNTAWAAIDAVRGHQDADVPQRLTLTKRLPIEAGLGGGSADAAAALAAAGVRFGADAAALAGLAPRLGSDVPFCLVGGTARIGGAGDVVRPMDFRGGYALAFVVPPFSVPTGSVYSHWDAMEGPTGAALDPSALPPVLRDIGPVRNDLFPAARDLFPGVGDWHRDLESAWSLPVAMTGSGPTLFGFFGSVEEAGDALRVVPHGARAAEAVVPSPIGWALQIDDAWTASSEYVIESTVWPQRLEDRAASDPVRPQ